MGLLDSLNDPNGALAQGMQSPLFSLGMGLIGGAQPFANPAQQIQGARTAQLQQMWARQQYALNQQLNPLQVQQAQLQLQQQQYGLKMFQQSMPTVMRTLTALGLLAGSPAGQPQDSQASAAAAPSGGLLAAGQQPSGASAFPLGQAPGAGAAPTPQGAPPPGGGGIDPNQAERASLGMSLMAPFNPIAASVAPALGKYAEFQAQNNPALITQREAAKSEFAQVQQQMAANPALSKQLWISYLTKAGLVHVSNNNGTISAMAGIPLSSLGIQTTTDGKIISITPQGAQAHNIPGYVQAQAQLAGATEAAKSANERVPVYDAPGNEVGNLPRATNLSNTGLSFGLGPEAHGQMTAAGEDTGKAISELNSQASASSTMNQTLERMRALGQSVQLGPTAPAREWGEKVLSPLANAFGVAAPSQKELGSYQELDKYSNTLGINLSRTLGSREAAQIVQLAINSNPNKSLQQGAYFSLIDGLHAANNYQIAQNQAIQAASSNGGNGRQAMATWSARVNPSVWDLTIPSLAQSIYSTLSPQKIADTMGFMSNEDAVSVLRNIGRGNASQVLGKLSPQVKGQVLNLLQQTVPTGATASY